MNPGTHFKDGYQWAVDSTSLKAMETCPTYYKYSMIESWEPVYKSVHLLFGGWYATALEHFHKHRAAGLSSDAALEEVVYEALVSTWGPETDPSGNVVLDEHGVAKHGPWQSLDTNKNRETLIRSIVWYVEHFSNDGLETYQLENGRAGVELSFSLDLEQGYTFVGHLDRVVWSGDELYILDQKTTGSTITQKFFDGFSPDIQMSGYTFAGKAILEKPVRGVIVDGAQIAVGFTRFERGFVHRSNEELNEWYDNIMGLVAQYRVYAETGHYPMNTSACGNYGGCPFRKVCSRSPGVRKNFLAGDFVKRKPWNPLERR